MNLYFNEHDKYAAQWLRNLYPDAIVDQRDIQDVQPADVANVRRAHFFGGIAGWQLALDIAGWGDAEVWTGSCPCQPLSDAGKRKGEKDERHLWPEFYRLISERRPATIFGEQVASAAGREWLDGISLDLEELGYAVAAADLCAPCVSSPNKRQRLWWGAVALANTGSGRQQPRARRSRNQNGTRSNGLELESNGKSGRMANTTGVRIAEHERDAGERAQGGAIDTADDCGAGRLGDSCSTRQPQRTVEQDGQGIARQQGTAIVSPGAAWLRTKVIECRDGRARRISAEPGDEPLAYGIPGDLGRRIAGLRSVDRRARSNRVGRLRCYGNAINVYVAAEFIKAFIATSARC